MARRRRLRAACVLVAVLAIASSFRAVEATETAARGGGEDDARDSTTTVRGAGGGARRRLPRETESDDDLLRDDVHDDVRDAAEAEAEANDDDASPRADLPPLIVDADAPALARRDDGDARPRVGLRSRIARIRRAIAAASDATIRDAKMAWSTWTNRVAAALEESGARDAWRKRRWGKLARDLFPEESRVVAAFWRAGPGKWRRRFARGSWTDAIAAPLRWYRAAFAWIFRSWTWTSAAIALLVAWALSKCVTVKVRVRPAGEAAAAADKATRETGAGGRKTYAYRWRPGERKEERERVVPLLD